MDDNLLPITVYGSDLSYFTGKLEMYLRIKGIAYRFEPMLGPRIYHLVERETGATQMPAAMLADGRWMTDTTPIIAWLEEQQPEPRLVPADPLQRFFCLLLEDYADEWLWRTDMPHRWYTDEGAMLPSRHMADELLGEIPLPGFLKRFYLRRRQRGGYTAGDGVTEANHPQVEQTYLHNLDWLQSILATRPFLLGQAPSLADVGFMGPFFRHFSQDPVPAEIMRQRAPAVWEWITRMWNCSPERARGDWLTGVPDDWGSCLDDIGAAYLPYLCENVLAVRAGRKRWSVTVDGVYYPNARASAYRVWCLEQLQAAFEQMPEAQQQEAQLILERHGCWEPLWRFRDLDSGINRERPIPFYADAKMHEY
jgi:glutathione S-transferase